MAEEMKVSEVGTLHVKRVARPRGGRIDQLLADLIDPRYYKDPNVYFTSGEKSDGRAEIVWRIDGKAKQTVSIDDDGRPVRVSGTLRPNESYARMGRPKKLGSVVRVNFDFLDEPQEEEAGG